ncbi:MAG: hypothetical protein BECKG1743E_GA0114224_105681 [Candidatus Kentron sp. G]|nr:MAG: hypothetical protein BECKG1743E_GA0114224_105681 [Candidatus Kentron sp. G]
MGECLGANTGGEHLGSPYAPPNVGANLVFAHYARFALMPKSCGSTALYYHPSFSCFLCTFSVRSLCPEGAAYHSPGLRRQPLPLFFSANRLRREFPNSF